MIKHGRHGMGQHTVLMGKPEGKRPLRRPRRRWDDDIKIDLKVMFWNNVNWINLALVRDQWQALVNTLTKFLVP
jgi:hypothetical protein